MKYTLSILLTFLIVLASCKDKSIQIAGKLSNPVKGEFVFLDELKSNTLETVDSLQISADGKFSFKRDIGIPTFYLLKINNNNFFTILAEPGEKIKITAAYDSLSNPVSITGSAGTSKMIEYNKFLKNTVEKLSGLSAIYDQNADNPNLPKVIESLDSMAQSYLSEINAYTKNYIDENITSLVSLVALYQQVAQSVYVLNPLNDLAYFVKVDSTLFSLYPESEPVKSLHEQVQALVKNVNQQTGQNVSTQSGEEVPEIALPSPDGEIIKLSSTRGKIVLLDFWASWCGPCRKESPNLVQAYNMYKNKGFQIYQVSLDKTKEDWVTGIETDKLGQWLHVSDLKYWNSVVVPQFKIESIPFNLLLDKEGKIIASNLRGGQLMTKLAEIIK
jgi:thiol-disulfide isomerase/thioredoxin